MDFTIFARIKAETYNNLKLADTENPNYLRGKKKDKKAFTGGGNGIIITLTGSVIW